MGVSPDQESFSNVNVQSLAGLPTESGMAPKVPSGGQKRFLHLVVPHQQPCQGDIELLGRVVSARRDFLADPCNQFVPDAWVIRPWGCAALAQSLWRNRWPAAEQPGRQVRALQTRTQTVLQHR